MSKKSFQLKMAEPLPRAEERSNMQNRLQQKHAQIHTCIHKYRTALNTRAFVVRRAPISQCSTEKSAHRLHRVVASQDGLCSAETTWRSWPGGGGEGTGVRQGPPKREKLWPVPPQKSLCSSARACEINKWHTTQHNTTI